MADGFRTDDVVRVVTVDTCAHTPRWGAVVAGVVTTLALLTLLGELGMAIGLSAFEPGDRAGPYLIGAGIWGLVSVILSFLGGGYLAAYLARTGLAGRGPVHGGLVWATTVPMVAILAAFLTIGAATAAGTTAAAAAETAAETAPAETREAARGAAETARDAAARATPQDAERASKTAGALGWGMVAALVLSLGAAVLGGVLGAKAQRVPGPTAVEIHESRAAVA